MTAPAFPVVKFALRNIKAVQPHIGPLCHELAIKLA